MTDKTVICVDDEPSLLNSYKRLLRKEGCKTITTTSGREALEVLESTSVRLVISDERMPEMTGTELLKRVKERWPETTRFIVSGYAPAEALSEALESGEVHRFFSKPWNDEELRTAVRACLTSDNFGGIKTHDSREA